MNRIFLIGYRDWAINAFSRFKKITKIQSEDEFELYAKNSNFNEEDVLVFVGWSKIIPQEFVDKHICLCLHPSDLPFYRGGSPIQHQRLEGITKTKMTCFRMDDGVDTGNIIHKTDLLINGHMKDIFNQLSLASVRIIEEIIVNINNKGFFLGVPQRSDIGSSYKRRKPEDSEITISDLQNLLGNQLFDKISCLEDPYPNAFIKTKDGKKLLIKLAELE